LIESIRSTPNALKYLTNWGLNLDTDLNILQGRTLPMEKILFEGREVDPDFRLDWTKSAGNERCIKGIDLNNWICIFPSQKEQIVERFAMLAIECGKKIGVRIAQPTVVKLVNDKPEFYYQEIKKYLTRETQLIFIVLNMLSDARYQRVKKLCCIECPVPSQCVVVKTINKPDNVLRTVAQKIVLQMNVKLGGELWRLVIPIKKIMIVGIDVYHKTEKQYKSIAGFVSSLNPEQTRWYSKVCFQMVGQEVSFKVLYDLIEQGKVKIKYPMINSHKK
jgi:aubergine-like protein